MTDLIEAEDDITNGIERCDASALVRVDGDAPSLDRCRAGRGREPERMCDPSAG